MDPDTDDELLAVLHSVFSTEEEQLFVQSFKAYLNYGDDDKAFVINLDDVWQWLGYTRDDSAKKALVRVFKQDIDYLVRRVAEQDEHRHGGHNKLIISMNIKTFKKFCMKANTERADQICNYYLKMEEVFLKYMKEKVAKNKIFIERNKIAYNKKLKQIKDENEAIKKTSKDKLIRHNILLELFSNRPCVYVALIQELENGDDIIKIGSTYSTSSRYDDIKISYGSQFLYQYVFECDTFKAFEDELHSHPDIVKHRYAYRTSKECYLISKCFSYTALLDIIKKGIKKHKGLTTEQKLEEKRIDLKMMELEMQKIYNDSDKKDLIDEINRLKIDNDTLQKELTLAKVSYQNRLQELIVREREIATKITEPNGPAIKPRPHANSPRVQLYDADKNYIKTFSSITEALRGIPDSSYSGLKNAAKVNSLYKGHRFYLLDHDDEDKPLQIPDTADIQTVRFDYIAQVNIQKTKVIEVYPDQRGAALATNVSPSAINKAVNNESVSSGHYFIRWNDLPDALKFEYMETNDLPEPPKQVGSVSVQQLDKTTREVIATYNSITDVIQKYQISRATLKKKIELQEEMKGYLWRFVDE
jgi:hypothetical protein